VLPRGRLPLLLPRRLRFGVIAAALLLAGCGDSGSSASYVGSARDTAVYVSWTRTKDSLSGQFTRALASATPGAPLRSDRVNFTGKVSGDAVSLQLAKGLGSMRTLTGALDGDSLVLSYPGADGGAATLQMHQADAHAFDSDLAALRAHAGGSAATGTAADVAKLAADVRARIATLAPAAKGAQLAAIRAALKIVEGSYANVTTDQADNYVDTICDDVASLDGQVKTMQAAVGAMKGGDPTALAKQVSALRAAAGELAHADPKLVPAGAPTAQDVDAAITAARQTVSGAAPANASAAQRLLDQAKRLQRKADAACRSADG
jgi:hypothetical protein